jgi:acyl-CoA thioester hydrolase
MSAQQFECRVYFEDTDAGGVVYNANYLKYYERARTEYLRALGYEQDELLANNIVFVVRHIDIDFVRAARFNEILRVESHIEELKKASLLFVQSIYACGTGQEQNSQKRLVNQARVKVVCVSANEFRPTAIPTEIYQVLTHE